ncbi:hypothetical protein DAPPUDRAFT_235877 [Daphnia pulex]|uniref:Uncharacterized protein n=1 Tax=Daphnia pulex TaxID=6669 RepID=E9FZA3_DAPPU|nr:hypothetical protein DAPPUDRAFT_235877 [Daphnia pulex]|eukprot:EFX87301.1 hypothetical protein DAPPUDRAFT_235877 [Daphnia pulex]
MAAAWRIVFVDNSIIRNANMFHQDIWPHHQQSQAIQNIYASPIYVLVPDSAKAKQAVLPVELRASSNVITSTGAVVVNRRRIGKIADNYQEPIGRGEDFKGTWHGCQAAVKEIRSPWRCSTVVEARSFAKMIKREVEALSAVRYYWTARRESNDADRSPSHRETLHLLHSTQQKPGGSVMVHRDNSFSHCYLEFQRHEECEVTCHRDFHQHPYRRDARSSSFTASKNNLLYFTGDMASFWTTSVIASVRCYTPAVNHHGIMPSYFVKIFSDN